MQKSLFSSIFFLTISIFGLQAQLAPDFTVTDSDGMVHNLHADYLDKGTTVVIKVFFTTCPPCNTIAPSVQDLYEDWGSGNYDVQFIEITNKSFDSNADVALYKIKHGLTFPGIGDDGGAPVAIAPYLRGDFGRIFGQPSFAVIAPDKTVTVQNLSSSFAGLISDVNDAIIATGAKGDNPPPPPPADPALFTFDITDAFSKTINNVELTLESFDGSVSYPIDASKTLEINNLQEQYPNLTDPHIRVKKTDDIALNVTALDLFGIQRHILGKEALPNSVLESAADVDGLQGITALDLFFLQRLILGKESSFPNKDSFEFTPREIQLNVVLGESQTLSFKGVKTGDIDGL